MASRNIFLPKESNRRIPNGTYGGVRGMNNLYSIAFQARRRRGCLVFAASGSVAAAGGIYTHRPKGDTTTL